MRLDSITPGSLITIRLDNSDDTEQAVFVGITGDGEDRCATLISETMEGGSHHWEAYRMNKRWVYGSSADSLSVVAVVAEGGRSGKESK